MRKWLWLDKLYTEAEAKNMGPLLKQYGKLLYYCDWVHCENRVPQLGTTVRKYCCDAHRQAAWRDRQLADKPVPKMGACALPGCDEVFMVMPGGIPKQYCCNAHRVKAFRMQKKASLKVEDML